MIPYSLNQLLFFFYVYCFFGWIIETTWVSAHQKKFVNRGFMRGPFIPIYGSGAMVMLLAGTPLLKWPILVFLAGMIAASTLEYFTGAAMEAIFKVRYWDYSDKPLNLNGHICMFTSVCWGLLSIALDYFIHKPVENLSVIMPGWALEAVVDILSVYFIVDYTLSFKAAFDLRTLIIKLDEAKQEMKLMQKRLDVVIAYAELDNKEMKEKMEERLEDFSAEIQARIKELHKDFYKRGIFAGNPTLRSKKFDDSVNTLKAFLEKERQEMKNKLNNKE